MLNIAGFVMNVFFIFTEGRLFHCNSRQDECVGRAEYYTASQELNDLLPDGTVAITLGILF